MKEELLENYKAALSSTNPKPYVATAASFLKWLGGREFNEDSVLKWLEHLRNEKEGKADGTIVKVFNVVKRLAKVNGILLVFKSGSTPQIRETSVYAPLLDINTVGIMVDCVRGGRPPLGDLQVEPEHAAFLALSTVYGLRRVEMSAMIPEFVDLNNRRIFVQTAKRGRQRHHLIPECIIPYLEAWGFQRRLSESRLSELMAEIKAMVGLDEDEIGWHAIRRSAVREAFNCGLTEPEILSFYRWRKPRSSMPLSYAMGTVVGLTGSYADVSYTDRGIDDKIFNSHPFVKFWEEA